MRTIVGEWENRQGVPQPRSIWGKILKDKDATLLDKNLTMMVRRLNTAWSKNFKNERTVKTSSEEENPVLPVEKR